MAKSRREPTDADSPFFRAAHERADEVEQATTSADRRKAWARVASAGAAGLVEVVLRDTLIWGAVLFSIGIAVLGLTSGSITWMISGLGMGVAGLVLVPVALRRWSFGLQWGVYLGVVLVQCVLMVALWQSQ